MTTVNGFERITTFEPAYDKRNTDPNKNYGIHGVNLRMVLKGPKGAVHFLLYTNWMLPHVRKELDEKILSKAMDGVHEVRSAQPLVSEISRKVDGKTGELLEKAYRFMGEPRVGLDLLDLDCTYHPQPADLGYHSPTPMYESQTSSKNCHWLDGKSCYYDGSGLAAERIFEVLVAEGSDGVWRELENYYEGTFGDVKK